MANLRPLQCLSLDATQQKKFIAFFKALPEKPSTTIRFFDRSEYYSCHGPDADFIAKCVFRSTSTVKIMAPAGLDEELRYVVLSKNNFENIVRELLLIRNYRVEVYVNKGSMKSSNDWNIERMGSPGNLSQFEDLLFTNNNMIAGSALIALHLKQDRKQKIIGMSCIDTNERIFFLLEFVDDDFFTELEAIIVMLGPKECILPAGDEVTYYRIKHLLERNNVIITTKKKLEFSVNINDVIQDLNKLLLFNEGQQQNANTIAETSKVAALASLGVAIRYLELTKDSSNDRQFQLKLLNHNRFVHMDAAAVKALNIFPKPGTTMSSSMLKKNSVLGVLDRCRTPQGHRLMEQWLKQPLRNYDIIKERHDIVECFIANSDIHAELRDSHLKRLPDILITVKKLFRKKASLRDIFRVYQVLMRVPKILRALENLDNTSIRNIIQNPLKNTLGELMLFKALVEHYMDLEAVERGEYLVNAYIDETLKEYKETMEETEFKMRKLLSKTASELGLEAGTSIKLDFVAHHGFHFRITMKHETIIRKNTKFQMLDAVKGGVRFTDEKLTDYNADFSNCKESYELHQKTIVDDLVHIVIGYIQSFTVLNNQIANLDCYLSFATAAISAPKKYVRPKMFHEGEGRLKLVELRHPCLELQDDIVFIPNNAVFQKNDTTMYIVTGPNMGGKSTFIRSVGVAVLMAHVGSFVPCNVAEITIVDSILGRIGAEDNLCKGLSTFMVEMVETAAIIRTATENSMIIIDELGRGTSTYEGCGIAWSIAEHLAKETKCFSLFATHFHEISEIAKTTKTVKSCHMDAIANEDSFILLYQIKPGVMLKSFGIEVAKLANFPTEVVKLAQKLYEECEDHYSHLHFTKDKEGIRVMLESLDKIGDINPTSEESIISILDDVRNCVRGSTCAYFRKIFPYLYTSNL